MSMSKGFDIGNFKSEFDKFNLKQKNYTLHEPGFFKTLFGPAAIIGESFHRKSAP